MGANDFDWRLLPADLLTVIADALDFVAADDVEAICSTLRQRFGSLPTEEFARACWPEIRDIWVLPVPDRVQAWATELRGWGIGQRAQEVSVDDADFLSRVRSTVRLRELIVAIILSFVRSSWSVRPWIWPGERWRSRTAQNRCPRRQHRKKRCKAAARFDCVNY
ncbi:MAG: hypothetical protein WCP28_19135 [Actinomycetes bacterium]